MAKRSENSETKITSEIVDKAAGGALQQVKDIVDVQASISSDDIADLAVAAFETRLEQREDELKEQRDELRDRNDAKQEELRKLCDAQGAAVAERFAGDVEKAIKKADVKEVKHTHSCESHNLEDDMLTVAVTFYVTPLAQANDTTLTLYKRFKPTTGRVAKLIDETSDLLGAINKVESELHHIKSKATTGKERIRRKSKLTLTAQRVAAAGPDGEKLLRQILEASGNDKVVQSLLGE